MVNLVLLSGFLGSGKTTCLNNLISVFDTEKIGVIVNEFGKVSIDTNLIKNKTKNIVELNNGSIFCQCIKDNFIKVLCDMVSYDIKYLFVESSGLADHSNILSILQTVHKETGLSYDYKGCICIVDAVFFMKQVELLPTLQRQIKYSSLVIINKVDLQRREEIEKIKNKIKSINQYVSIIETVFCKFDIRESIANMTVQIQTSEDTTNSINNRPETVILTFKHEVEYSALEHLIKILSNCTFRVKGFVLTDRGNVVVNSVATQISIEKWNQDIFNSKLVVISNVGIKIISILTKFISENNLVASIDT